MGRQHRERIIEDSLDNWLVTFSDLTTWQLKKKLSEKPWEEGTDPREGSDWEPSEAHAVYECVQVQGPLSGSVAIMKVRIELPFELFASDDSQERAKDASGMRLNSYTIQENESLERLTTAKCSVAPKLLAVKVDTQDESILKLGIAQWWMPGGYIVYILMTKLPGQSLDLSFWNTKLFSEQERNAIRLSFREAFLEVQKIGIQFHDPRIENILWDKTEQRCYLFDFEMSFKYCPDYPDPEFMDGEYYLWNLARRWGKPEW